MNWFYVISVILVTALVACPFYLLERLDVEAAPDEVVSYDTYPAKIRSIDPATCSDTTSSGLQGNIYESLYGYHHLKRPIELIPQLAAEMPKVSDDGLTYIIRLKKGVKYHRNECFPPGTDGIRTREVEAKDFVLAFKRIADANVKTSLAYSFIQKVVGIQDYHARTRTYAATDFSRYNLPVEGIQAVDKYTLRIQLTEPFPQFNYVLAMHNYAPYPREAVDYYLAKRGDPEIRKPAEAVGAGAYYLAEWVEGDHYVLKRNPDYRRQLYPSEGAPGDRQAGLLEDAGKPLPFIDVLVRRCVVESNPMWMLFMTRQTDTAYIPTQHYQSAITPDKKLTEGLKKQGIRLIKYKSPKIYWLAFNMKDPIVGSSKSLRQAICLGYDVEEYIDLIRNGRSIRAKTVIPSTFEGHDRAHSPYAHYDLEAAKRKLVDARKELVEAGVIEPGQDIPELTLSIGGWDELHRKMGDFAVRQFRKIGLKLEIELNDWPTLQEKVDNDSVQMYWMGWHADYPDPENFLQLFYGENIDKDTNDMNYRNPRFDELYEKVAVMQPSPQRTDMYVKMLSIINEDSPCAPQTEPIDFVLAHEWVKNIKPHPVDYGHTKYIRIDTELRNRKGGE